MNQLTTLITRGLNRHRWSAAVAALVASAMLLVLSPAAAHSAVAPEQSAKKPTVVLVHGAWADAASWGPVVSRLQAKGYRVIATGNPLRSLSSDSAYLKQLLDTIDGPTVLVGHSYGASVITNAAVGDRDVRALVYINGSVPAAGETVAPLAGPDSALAVADPTTIFDFVPGDLPPTAESDLYLKRDIFMSSFATGVPRRQAEVLWATQRPVTFGALNEPSGKPAWKSIPSWYLIGTGDRVIPPSAQSAMALKAGSTVSRYRAGHLGLLTNPGPVTKTIIAADRSTR